MEIDYGLKQDYLLTECCIACLTEKGHLHGETITINCYKEFIDTRVIYTNEFDVYKWFFFTTFCFHYSCMKKQKDFRSCFAGIVPKSWSNFGILS